MKPNYPFFKFYLVLILFISCIDFASAQCNRQSDSLVLISIYNSTDGANWVNTWDLTQPINNWFGISLNSDGCVVCIDLDGTPDCSFATVSSSGNNLRGALPIEIGLLSGLTTLSLANNTLVGQIPHEIGNLRGLEICDLSNNSLAGNIPIETGNMNALRHYSLSSNFLNGAIPQLYSVPNLLFYDLSRNLLSGPIAEGMDIPFNLEWLDFSFNQLSDTIPSAIGRLSKLKTILLNDNILSGSIPIELGSIPALERIALNDNNLSNCFDNELVSICSIGSGVGGASGYNFINNPLLPWQGDFERFCNGEQQEGAPCDDGDPNTQNDVIQADCTCAPMVIPTCREVDSLALVEFYNATDGANWTNTWDLNSSIDTWFGVELNANGCVLRLQVGDNNLSGELIDFQLPNLAVFVCNRNNLSGTIPDFSGIPNLKYFSCAVNNFSGRIPDFSNFPFLERFDCCLNQLTGSIPDFSNMAELAELNCFENQLTGTIPNFSNLPNLREFQCFKNNLSGEIPDFSNLPMLEKLFCSNNQLIGEIPDFLNVENLKTLQCDNNLLSGEIPNFSNLPNLTHLICFLNELSGQIPDFTNLSNLSVFNCGGNNLSGPIPDFSNVLNLQEINCSFNNLSGCFPSNTDFCQITYAFHNNQMLPWEGDYERYCNNEPQVGAPCDDGDSNTTNDVILDDCTCGEQTVSTENPALDEMLKVYPNPTDGKVWLQGPKIMSAVAYNSLGVTVPVDFSVESQTLQFQSNVSGVFFLNLQTTTQTIIKKLRVTK